MRAMARTEFRRGKHRQTRPGRSADKDSADDAKGHAPAFGRDADLRECHRGVIARDRRRCREEKGDGRAHQWRARGGENSLAYDKDERPRDKGDDDCTEYARAGVIGRQSGGDRREERGSA